MALDKTSLQNGIEALHNELFANAGNLSPAQAATRYAQQMATLIDTFVKTGKPQVPGAGLISSTPGNAVTGISVTGTII